MMGGQYADIGFRATLERMKGHLAEREAPKGQNRGRGVAAGLWFTGCMGSAAHICVTVDGSIALVVGSTDVSGTRTSFAQMVAEEFEIPFASGHRRGGRYGDCPLFRHYRGKHDYPLHGKGDLSCLSRRKRPGMPEGGKAVGRRSSGMWNIRAAELGQGEAGCVRIFD